MQQRGKSFPGRQSYAEQGRSGRPKAILRLSLVFWYLWACLRYRVNPWNYFAINSPRFNWEKGIFSKLDMDALIPPALRLRQHYYDAGVLPRHYPVFLKPEWGQNSKGVVRGAGENAYRGFEKTAGRGKIPYIVQEAGPGRKEFEVYYLRQPGMKGKAAFLSVTEVVNCCEFHHPVNSIHNPCTRYREITPELPAARLDMIWQAVKGIGDFPMARVGIKADSWQAVTQGRFKVVEINLFLPMPLVLFTENISFLKKQMIILYTMHLAARLAKQAPAQHSGLKVFFKKMMKM